MTSASRTRPAFYALTSGGWRDYVTLLHPPYTLWHLSYVVIGASLVPGLQAHRLVWGLLAFFLAMGVGAHALDELNGRPLRTRIPASVLITVAIVSIGAATAIGVGAAIAWTLWLVPFVVFGAFIAFAYTLELAGGLFHGDLWFALAWGAFPVLTAYVGVTALLSAAQRRLSTQVRNIRRRVNAISGSLVYIDGSVETIDESTLLAAPEAALRALSAAVVALAVALVLLRLG